MSQNRTRDEKGFDWEMETQRGLHTLKVTFWGNPTDFKEWLKNKGKGADIIIEGLCEVECKFNLTRVYWSWILRDWLPRFSDNPDIDKIIVSNFKWRIPRQCRELLYEHGIKLMNREEFIWYVLKNLKRANKNNYLNNVIQFLNLYVNGYVIKTLEGFLTFS